ncbi:hypothetical protein V6N12_024663 [Hibiscus sabdariffa]|uniref:V-ATPase proteolipid subunit C-like domain-containing protein n=1 Tax=Hibiscus sabdariffa TaxID=183260 RepID=A0ABR2G1F2_9ROSI
MNDKARDENSQPEMLEGAKSMGVGAATIASAGVAVGSEGTAIMTTTCVSFSSILSLIAFYEVAPGASAYYLRIAPWISSEMFDAF